MPSPIYWTKKTDEFAYKIYDLYAYIKYIMKRPMLSKELNENQSLKDVHKGGRCFILGTGPSLEGQDLSLLRNEITIGTNKLYVSKEIDKIHPDYYCMTDMVYFQDESHLKALFEKCGYATFLFNIGGKNIVDGVGGLSLDEIKIRYIYGKHMPNDKRIRTDLSGLFSGFSNVVCSAITCALYMGFSEIYLLGCDFNQFVANRHIYEKDEKKTPSLPTAAWLRAHAIMAEQHEYISAYAKANNIKIQNATPKSLLDAYQMVDFESLF